jgi:hypothetical protein
MTKVAFKQPTAISTPITGQSLEGREQKKAVGWCAHGPIFYVKSPVDGRTTPHVKHAGIGTPQRHNARERLSVVH